ncbi:importin-13 isoform X1 [Cydia fagiglandana]|uniref:importin-13 isoform X1 n=1 Tax=Cydia fagiglandana TaxID=1458189 RepID=UPI002FEE3A00
MEYSPENLEYAVSVFYNGEQADRAKAHAWLTDAQRVPEAWKFVWELLQPNKYNFQGTEIQFYAATTLHTKILRCWNEVPPESHDELKEKLLQAVYTYSKGPKIVTNRLCISLAAFILQQGTSDLAAILRPLSAAENTSLLLEVLTVIPEEYNSMTMGTALRAKNRSALTHACPAVLDDLLRYLQSVYNEYSSPPPDSEVQLWLSAATCAASWLALNEEGDNGPLPDRLPLCGALLAAVRLLYTWNEAVSDVALDVCEACLGAVRAAAGQDSTRQPAAALQLIEQLVATAAPVFQRDNRPDSINEELLSALITCLVGVGETHAGAVVRGVEASPAGPARQLLELLLCAQAAPGHYPRHEARSNLVFGFWYTLQDEILNVMETTSRITPVWRDVFSRLLTILVAKSEAPPDSALSRDDQELLRCYRQDIADTVMYCVGILGDWCWTTVEAAWDAADTPLRKEAALHVFLALADSAPHRRAPEPIHNMLGHAVEAARTENGRMLDTALDCLGSYAGWVAALEGAGGAALGAECAAAAGAALGRAGAAAALALRKLCADCAAPAARLAPDIVRAAQSEQARSDAWMRRQLLSAAGSALAAADPEVATPLLHELAASLAADLRRQAEDPTRASGAAECAAALLAALPAQPVLCLSLCQTLLPNLSAFACPLLVEPMFHVLKQTVSSLMDDCRPLVDAIGQLTAAGFRARPTAAGLDVVKLLVIIFGNEYPSMPALFHSCVALSARGVAAEPGGAPDLAEALFAVLRQVTKKKPAYIDWIDDLLSELVELGSECVRMWEAGAARSACLWLGALAAVRPRALQPHAPLLTAAALRCIGGATPRNQIEPLAELLLALNRAAFDGGDLSAWLRQALAVADFPTRHATEPSKRKFIAAVIKEKSSKRRLLESVQEFSLVCRGLVGTEYARQSLAAKQLVS